MKKYLLIICSVMDRCEKMIVDNSGLGQFKRTALLSWKISLLKDVTYKVLFLHSELCCL
jgi:hypothetical protein